MYSVKHSLKATCKPVSLVPVREIQKTITELIGNLVFGILVTWQPDFFFTCITVKLDGYCNIYIWT